eukprot:jgi/Tetstr1/428806/TSEL_018793.t1
MGACVFVQRNLDLDAKVRDLLASYYGEAAFSAVAADLLKPCGEDWLASQVLEGEGEGEGEGKASRIQWKAVESMLEQNRAEPADEEAGLIRQPRRIAGGGSVARGIAVQWQCARRHPAKAEPARAAFACCPAASHVRPGGEPVVKSRVRDGRGRYDRRACCFACAVASPQYFQQYFGAGASQRNGAGVPTGQEVSERPQPRQRGGNRGLALTGIDALARLQSMLHGSKPARRGVAPAAAWTVADALSVARIAAGVAWAPRIDTAANPHHMSMETAVPIDFQVAWAEAQRCVNERVVAAVEADDPVVLDRALKWKYMLPQCVELTLTSVRRYYLVGTADAVVALVDGELSRAAGRLSSKGMGDLSDHAILAHLRDKQPSRSHPIPDAAYDIPVDEAALMVDMRVPYQQLKQHVATGPPSGMRNEYLRCLVGEYALASGPAAVRAMSEVASMYLQVGEAERRAAERAVVDNMKEAYVSVLAPSQLGVGISAGDSMLIHGVRLIAENLGPRAVIVHTDLRNAYNEAWRRTIIQRHIDCSPLHHVIPALVASLSTD